MRQRSVRGPAAGPSLVAIVAISVLAGTMRATGAVLGGPDPFWHWDLGRRIVRNGLPNADPYSFLTDGRDWILNQWGTEAIVGLMDLIGGLWLVAVFGALLVAGAYLHVGLRMWRRCPSLLTVAIFGLVYMAGMSNLSLRGNLFSYVMLPVVLAEMHRTEGPRPVVVLPVMAVWANLHAGFLMGVALITVHAIGEILAADPATRATVARRRGLLVLGASVATMITPYGPRLLWQSLALSLRGAGSGISEWGAPSLTATTVLPFTILVGISLVAVAVAAARSELPDILVTVAFVLLGASATRNLAPAAIVVGITAAPYVRRAAVTLRNVVDSGESSPVRSLDRVATATLALVGLLLVPILVPRTGGIHGHAANVPLQIVNELSEADRPIRAHATSVWAPAVAILGGDHVRITVDGRLELFTSDEIVAASNIESANPDWLDQLDEWCVTDVIVGSEGAPGVYLMDEAGWQRVMTSPVLGTTTDAQAVWYRRERELAQCP